MDLSKLQGDLRFGYPMLTDAFKKWNDDAKVAPRGSVPKWAGKVSYPLYCLLRDVYECRKSPHHEQLMRIGMRWVQDDDGVSVRLERVATEALAISVTKDAKTVIADQGGDVQVAVSSCVTASVTCSPAALKRLPTWMFEDLDAMHPSDGGGVHLEPERPGLQPTHDQRSKQVEKKHVPQCEPPQGEQAQPQIGGHLVQVDKQHQLPYYTQAELNKFGYWDIEPSADNVSAAAVFGTMKVCMPYVPFESIQRQAIVGQDDVSGTASRRQQEPKPKAEPSASLVSQGSDSAKKEDLPTKSSNEKIHIFLNKDKGLPYYTSSKGEQIFGKWCEEPSQNGLFAVAIFGHQKEVVHSVLFSSLGSLCTSSSAEPSVEETPPPKKRKGKGGELPTGKKQDTKGRAQAVPSAEKPSPGTKPSDDAATQPAKVYSAYTLWLSENRGEIASKFANKAEAGRAVNEAWRSLTKDKKDEYTSRAAKLRQSLKGDKDGGKQGEKKLAAKAKPNILRPLAPLASLIAVMHNCILFRLLHVLTWNIHTRSHTQTCECAWMSACPIVCRLSVVHVAMVLTCTCGKWVVSGR